MSCVSKSVATLTLANKFWALRQVQSNRSPFRQLHVRLQRCAQCPANRHTQRMSPTALLVCLLGNAEWTLEPGDFVDRGAWGVELLAVLAAWKLALPRSVLLLRGNHESTTCTKMYGFFAELQAKYGKPAQVTRQLMFAPSS